MDPLVKSSFIPKTPLTDTSRTVQKKGFGVFASTIIFLFIATVLCYGYVYIQTKKVVAQKAEYTMRIEKARKEIGTDFVGDMVALQKKISSVKKLLENHVAVSPIFFAIQDTTVQKVQYTDFSYTFGKGGGVEGTPTMVAVTMSGVAPDYKTIALQTDAFSQSSFIQDPIISDIKNDELTKTVSFKLEFKVDPQDVSYEKMFEGDTTKNPLELSYE